MSYLKLPQIEGVFLDDTSLAAEGSYVGADKIRFERGKAQTLGGWENASEDTFEGICRGLNVYADNSGVALVGIGTHTHLEVYQDGQIYDVTPITSYGLTTNPFSTTNGSPTITVNLPSHGMVDNQRIEFPNITGIGGASLNSVTGYTVTVVSASTLTFTADSNATQSSLTYGSTTDYNILLAPGLVDGTGNRGYGTGGYDVGGYGSPSTVDYFCRTWANDNWGQNLVANPRGGGAYEFAPLFTATQLVTNGDMSSATGWTQGTGWLIGGGVATASAGSASDLETSITMNPSAYFMLEFDVSRSAGTLSVAVGSTTIITAITTSTRQRQIFFTGTGNLKFSKSATFIGTVDNVSVKQLTRARIIPNAPIQNACMIVTPERIMMVGGTIDANSGVYNPLQLRWSDQDTVVSTGGPGNQAWTATASNQARYYTLSKGSRIVGLRNGSGEVLCWTDSALYRGRYVGPNTVYSWQLVGEGCGLIGPNAVTILGGIAYWMSPSGDFWRYAGGYPEQIKSTIGRDVKDNMAFVQQDKIFAFPSSQFGEVCWLYPDGRDGTECSRYALMGTKTGWWAPGTFDRSAWADAGPLPYAVATDLDGHLFFQEKGKTADGAVIEWSLTKAAFDLGEGNNLFQVNGFIPDFDDLEGVVTLDFGIYAYPGATRMSGGTFTLDAFTEKVDFILTGRQGDIVFSGSSAPCFMRLGSPRLDVIDTGMTI